MKNMVFLDTGHRCGRCARLGMQASYMNARCALELDV